jgi:hypothetical protein
MASQVEPPALMFPGLQFHESHARHLRAAPGDQRHLVAKFGEPAGEPRHHALDAAVSIRREACPVEERDAHQIRRPITLRGCSIRLI